MNSFVKLLSIGVVCTFLFACSAQDDHQDLRDYMSETIKKPKGEIDPLPTFSPYKSFVYSAMTQRSPFEKPVLEVQRLAGAGQLDVKPDLNREREFLESFNLSQLKMVGTLRQSGVLWALIGDDAGSVHRVKEGNYLGKNHGRIVASSDLQLELIEIVSDGLDGWLERPRTLTLEEKE